MRTKELVDIFMKNSLKRVNEFGLTRVSKICKNPYPQISPPLILLVCCVAAARLINPIRERLNFYRKKKTGEHTRTLLRDLR